MLRLRHFVLLLTCALLTACGSSSGWTPPEYSGRQESTEGVPGFDKGQKKSPYVKLGQSYKVLGEWHVPRFQPDYDEEGMASWYGPGFHGGKTANGEPYNQHAMTAAHRTLPLPSIVRVTMVDTGKSAIVRINDRGPFSKGRIIDLSKAAASEIGMLQRGTAKVRVQYMLAESQRFAELLAQGREPSSINIASEVLPYAGSTQYAAAEIEDKANRPVNDRSWWDDLSPVGTANAAEPPRPLYEDAPRDAAPTQNVASRELTPPATLPPPAAQPAPAEMPPAAPAPSVFDAMANAPPATAPPTVPRALDPPPQQQEPPSALPGYYVQVGTYSVESNAQAMMRRVGTLGQSVTELVKRGDAVLYRVRIGPYSETELAEDVLDRAHQMGLADARIVRP